MKNVAFWGIDTPIVLGILHNRTVLNYEDFLINKKKLDRVNNSMKDSKLGIKHKTKIHINKSIFIRGKNSY